MAADRQEVDPRLFGQDAGLAEALDSVHMEEGAGIAAFDGRADLLYGLYGADLIVGMHDRYQDGVLPDGRFDRLRGYLSFGIDGQICHFKSLLLQKPHGLQDRRMFDHRRNQMASAAPHGHGRADDGQVVGFGPAGGIDQVSGPDFQYPGQNGGSPGQPPFRFHSLMVHAGGIAVFLQI